VIIELVSHGARVLSLTVRLWVNMVVSELIYVTFVGLTVGLMTWLWSINKILGATAVFIPILIPAVFVGLHRFVAVLQAFVFTLLPTVYLGGAVAEEH
jgi:F-type H+-transporting ATPase subunit a